MKFCVRQPRVVWPFGIEVRSAEEELCVMLKTIACKIEKYFTDRFMSIHCCANAIFQLCRVSVQKNLDAIEFLRSIQEFLNRLHVVGAAV